MKYAKIGIIIPAFHEPFTYWNGCLDSRKFVMGLQVWLLVYCIGFWTEQKRQLTILKYLADALELVSSDATIKKLLSCTVKSYS